MAEVLKTFAHLFLALGGILLGCSLLLEMNFTWVCIGITGVAGAISMYILSGFCKIMEDTRDTLKRIEKLLDKENTQE